MGLQTKRDVEREAEANRRRQKQWDQSTLRVMKIANGYLVHEVAVHTTYSYTSLDEVMAHMRVFYASLKQVGDA